MNTKANRQARDDWELFATHRARLTAAIAGLAGASDGVLCLLGAGNCNDVDLVALAALCRPQGAALLASDVISSDHYPLDELPPDTDLRALAAELLPRHELVYTTADPLLVSRTLRQDPVLREAFAAPTTLDPWLWS